MNDKSTMNKILEYMALGKPIVQFDVTEGRVRRGRSVASMRAPTIRWTLPKKCWSFWPIRRRACTWSAFGRHRIETEMAWAYEVPRLIAAYQRVKTRG